MLVELQFSGTHGSIEPVLVELATMPRKGDVIDVPEEWRDEVLAGESFEVRNVLHEPSWPQDNVPATPPILVLG